MSLIELFDFIIYQHLNKRTKVLPLAISQITHLCNQSCLHCQFLSYVLKALFFFYQNSPKMKLFLQKNAKFTSARGSAPRPPCLRRLGALLPNPQNSPHCEFLPPRLAWELVNNAARSSFYDAQHALLLLMSCRKLLLYQF